jgi:hypothetical protein
LKNQYVPFYVPFYAPFYAPNWQMATISDVMAVALEHHRAGRLGEAEAIYRQLVGNRE